MAPRRILFDTDIGSDVDDALALGLILAAPELDLVAVTTVSSDVVVRARIAAGLLDLAGRSGVEVCAGERAPLAGGNRSFNWFGHEAQCVPEGARSVLSEEPAPQRIVRAAREVSGLEIVLVGPMTNLARALALDPELPRRVDGITIMGGHIRRVAIGEHVCPPGVDYNLCSDPEASVGVLGAGFRTTLVSADVTLQTWLRSADLARLDRVDRPLPRELAAQTRLWSPLQRKIFTGLGGNVDPDNEAFLHDPLTVLALIDPSPLRFEKLRIAATIEGGVFRSHEVAASTGIGVEMQVATEVDATRAERAIVERLLTL